MSKTIRYGLGALVTAAALYDIATINNLSYYENGQKKTKKLLTLLKLPFMEPTEGDLVLTIDAKRYEFKTVETSSGKYTDFNKYGMSMLVPQGFVLLRNMENGEKSLECYGAIVGQHSYDVSWLARIFGAL